MDKNKCLGNSIGYVDSFLKDKRVIFDENLLRKSLKEKALHMADLDVVCEEIYHKIAIQGKKLSSELISESYEVGLHGLLDKDIFLNKVISLVEKKAEDAGIRHDGISRVMRIASAGLEKALKGNDMKRKYPDIMSIVGIADRIADKVVVHAKNGDLTTEAVATVYAAEMHWIGEKNEQKLSLPNLDKQKSHLLSLKHPFKGETSATLNSITSYMRLSKKVNKIHIAYNEQQFLELCKHLDVEESDALMKKWFEGFREEQKVIDLQSVISFIKTKESPSHSKESRKRSESSDPKDGGATKKIKSEITSGSNIIEEKMEDKKIQSSEASMEGEKRQGSEASKIIYIEYNEKQFFKLYKIGSEQEIERWFSNLEGEKEMKEVKIFNSVKEAIEAFKINFNSAKETIESSEDDFLDIDMVIEDDSKVKKIMKNEECLQTRQLLKGGDDFVDLMSQPVHKRLLYYVSSYLRRVMNYEFNEKSMSLRDGKLNVVEIDELRHFKCEGKSPTVEMEMVIRLTEVVLKKPQNSIEAIKSLAAFALINKCVNEEQKGKVDGSQWETDILLEYNGIKFFIEKDFGYIYREVENSKESEKRKICNFDNKPENMFEFSRLSFVNGATYKYKYGQERYSQIESGGLGNLIKEICGGKKLEYPSSCFNNFGYSAPSYTPFNADQIAFSMDNITVKNIADILLQSETHTHNHGNDVHFVLSVFVAEVHRNPSVQILNFMMLDLLYSGQEISCGDKKINNLAKFIGECHPMTRGGTNKGITGSRISFSTQCGHNVFSEQFKKDVHGKSEDVHGKSENIYKEWENLLKIQRSELTSNILKWESPGKVKKIHEDINKCLNHQGKNIKNTEVKVRTEISIFNAIILLKDEKCKDAHIGEDEAKIFLRSFFENFENVSSSDILDCLYNCIHYSSKLSDELRYECLLLDCNYLSFSA